MDADEGVLGPFAGLAADDFDALLRRALWGAADKDGHGLLRLPAEGRSAAGEFVDGVPADEGVDDHRLESGVPASAGLRGPGVDVGGGEGDLAGVDEHGLPQRRLFGGAGDVGHPLLDDLDDDLEQLEGLLQADRADEVAGR
ncbi:Uncharacterised protein [Mycobacteroides abscessus subsp. abscessus]|nr:Uncharacterised protein [Mycobacteroides abscessus subsp. abscessus]